MNVLSMLGRGAATVGRGVGKGLNAWLDYASMGGLPMDMYYPGGAPDDVKKVMRRDYLQSLGAALGSDRPGMAQELHRSHALDYLNALRSRELNAQFQTKFGGVTNPSPEDAYKMANFFASSGDSERAMSMYKFGSDLAKQLAELNQLDGTSYDVQNPDGSVTKQQRTKNGQVVTLGATPENFGSPTQGVFNGQPGMAAVGNRGTVRVLPGAAPLPPTPVQVNRGDKIEFRDPSTGRQVGESMDTTPAPTDLQKNWPWLRNLSPEEQASVLRFMQAGSSRVTVNNNTFNPDKPLDANELAAFGLPGGSTWKDTIGLTPSSEQERTNAGFAERMTAANTLLNNMPPMDALALTINPTLPKMLQSNAYRQFEQAANEFITAVLRKESGAVINEAEMAKYQNTWIPQPGDDATTLANKAAARNRALDAMHRSSGGAAHGRVLTDPSKIDFYLDLAGDNLDVAKSLARQDGWVLGGK